MKKHLFLLLFLLSSVLFAQNIELSNRLISTYHSKQTRAMNSDTFHDKFWLSPLLLQVKKNWDVLTPEAQSLFKNYSSRPTFTGTELITESGNFRFHYTTNGPAGESVATTDANSNGIPDYVDNMISKFAYVYTLYHTTTGFTVPPADGSNGGNAKYDVYISGIIAGDGVYGYVQGENYVYDNPNSSLTEDSAATSYMVLRNNYNDFGDQNVALSVTIAHEYMHAVQYGYDTQMDSWFMESAATWGEDFAFPGYDDNLQYLPSYFRYPDVALNWDDFDDGTAYQGHWYSTWLFSKFLSERTSNAIIKNIYEKSISLTTLNAIESELSTNWSSNFNTMFTNFSIANALLTSNSNYNPYTYARASEYYNYINLYGGLKYENTSPLNYTGTNINWSSQANGNNRLMRLGADFFNFTSNQNFKIDFTCASAETKLILVKKNANQVTYQSCIGGQSINVTDYANWTQFIPIVIRFDRNITNNLPTNYSFTVTAASLGVEELAIDTKIYPNPVYNQLNINTPLTNLKAEIYDFNGRKIQSNVLTEGLNELNFDQLNTGSYILQIIKDNEIVKSETIIKQ